MTFALMVSHLPGVHHDQYVKDSTNAAKAWGKHYNFFRRLSRLFES